MDPTAALTGARAMRALQVAVEQRFASGFTVLPTIDVDLAAGTILVLFGPSGAGKTTVLRQIAGLERPDAGRIAFGGDVWYDAAHRIWRPPQERRVGLVFQEPALFPHLSVGANLAYGVRPRNRDDSAKWGTDPAESGSGLHTVSNAETRSGSDPVAEIAMLLGIGRLEKRYPRELSGGEVQRVALARALAPGPRLLLLDEPFAALDAPTRVRLRRDVRTLLARIGTPAVLVTHDRLEALALGDSIAVAIGGRIRQTGRVADAFSHPADAEVAAALGVEAVLPARIHAASNGLLEVAVNDVVLQVAERSEPDPPVVGSDVYVCIRAEDVTLEVLSTAHASARNHLAARVLSILSEGPIDRVTLDCGFALDALITRRSRDDLNLHPGAAITAAIKATSIHVVPRA